MVVDTELHLAWAMKKFLAGGGTIAKGRVDRLEDLEGRLGDAKIKFINGMTIMIIIIHYI